MKTKFKTNAQSRQQSKAKAWRGILEDSRVLKAIFSRLVLVLVDGLTKEWCIALFLFIRACRRLAAQSGYLFLALYLKQSRVSIQRAVAGCHVRTAGNTLSPSVSLTRSGIPRIIPSFHRRKIRDGDPLVIQVYLSFCYL